LGFDLMQTRGTMRTVAALTAALAFSSLGLTTEPASAQFVQQGAKLVDMSAGPAFYSLGSSVALSADGNTAIVGGSGDSVTVGGARVYTRSGGVWTQQGPKLVGTGAVGTDALQGSSVALSADGNTAIVGGPGDNKTLGAVWVFTRSDGVWTQQGPKLVGTGAAGLSFQGSAVALSADGNTAIVGGSHDNFSSSNVNPYLGAAWVFTRAGNVWTQQGPKLVGTGAPKAGYQGGSVALSADGNTAIVGCSTAAKNSAAWAFTRRNGVWTQQGSGPFGVGGNGATQYDSLGNSVVLSADGNTAIIGGQGGQNDSRHKAAWVFTRSGGRWGTNGAELHGSGADGGLDGGQGAAVALSADGKTAIVGGPFDRQQPTPCCDPGAFRPGPGAVWVFTESGGKWIQQGAKLVGSGAASGAQQGRAVALSADGNTLIVGGPLDNYGVGAAWVFVQSAGKAPQ
jgi:hypothetical protein